MQKLTSLYIAENEDSLYSAIQKGWAMEVSELFHPGKSGGGIQISLIASVADRYMDNFFSGLLKTEETTLLSGGVTQNDKYFVALTGELVKIVERLYVTVRGIAMRTYSQIEKTRISEEIGTVWTRRRDRIIVQVQVIQEKLKLSKPSPSKTVIHIQGDAGMVNIGTIYGSVHAKLEKNMQAKDDKLMEALEIILKEIKNSYIGEQDMMKQMQNVEFLIDQYKSDDKKPGLLEASLKYLEGAANLTTIWSAYGATIVTFFKQFIN